MSRKTLVLLFVATCFCIAGISIAADKGPADMVLQAEKDKAKKPKPAVFPHAAHQYQWTATTCTITEMTSKMKIGM